MKYINKIIYILFILAFVMLIPSISAASAASKLYYEVEFRYLNVINNKTYTEEADLLRPQRWVLNNKLHKVGDSMVLSIPEFGVINAKAIVVKLIKTSLNPEAVSGSGRNMVTGKFTHYSNDVRAYQFKDLKTGYIQTIKSTPSHSFYVKNRTAYNKYLKQYSHFIEIQNITPKDILINENGHAVKLICQDQAYACGIQVVTHNRAIPVYNLEIFNKHQYLVITGKNRADFAKALLVHNMYGWDLDWVGDYPERLTNLPSNEPSQFSRPRTVSTLEAEAIRRSRSSTAVSYGSQTEDSNKLGNLSNIKFQGDIREYIVNVIQTVNNQDLIPINKLFPGQRIITFDESLMEVPDINAINIAEYSLLLTKDSNGNNVSFDSVVHTQALRILQYKVNRGLIDKSRSIFGYIKDFATAPTLRALRAPNISLPDITEMPSTSESPLPSAITGDPDDDFFS